MRYIIGDHTFQIQDAPIVKGSLSVGDLVYNIATEHFFLADEYHIRDIDATTNIRHLSYRKARVIWEGEEQQIKFASSTIAQIEEWKARRIHMLKTKG